MFRFQTSGSIRLRDVGVELTGRALSLFDDDQALTRGAKRVWSSSGSFGALIAVAVVVVVGRGILLTGVPNVALSFPFEAPTIALERFFGGWNESGLGSPSPIHPITGLTGIVSYLWFGSEGAARTLLTFSLGLIAVVGMGRLLGRLSVRGSGRYLAGLIVVAGPGTAALTNRGSWSALVAAAVLPWALRSVFIHSSEETRGRSGPVAWALISGWLLAAASPVLLVVPILAALIWTLQGGKQARVLLAIFAAVGGVVAVSFLSGDPGWVFDANRRLGVDINIVWPGVILLAAIPLFKETSRYRRAAGLGALLGLGGIVVWSLGIGGPGVEEAALVTASLGAAIVAGVALDRFSFKPLPLLSTLGGLAMLVLSVSSMLGGNLGLPAGDVNGDLAFAESLVADGQPRRVLYVSDDAALVPGEARPGPGYWYRVLDGSGTTSDEVWLPPQRGGDKLLDQRLSNITTGANLRPGSLLSEFSVGWIVIDGPENRLDGALANQFDIVPVPFDSSVRIYENPQAVPLALSSIGEVWTVDGPGFRGDVGSGRVSISSNYTSAWIPEGGQVSWYLSVAASAGAASYSGHIANIVLPYLALAVLLGSFVAIALTRRSA